MEHDLTRDDAKEIVLTLMAAYANFHPLNLSLTVDVWASVLGQYDASDAKRAVAAFISADTAGFAPSPGQVIALIHAPEDYAQASEMEAWAMVRKAISDGNYHARERFDELPEAVRSAVGSPAQIAQWAMSDIDSVETVAQSNFLRAYRAILERKKKLSSFPPYLVEMIDARRAQIGLGGIERKLPEIDRAPAMALEARPESRRIENDNPYLLAVQKARREHQG